MKTPVLKDTQALAIGRAMIAIVFLLGCLQTVSLIQLLRESWHNYREASQTNQLNTHSNTLFQSADQLGRASSMARILLNQPKAASPGQQHQLQQYQQQGKALIEKVLTILDTPVIPNHADYRQKVATQFQALSNLEDEANQYLATQQPQANIELGYSISLTYHHLMNTIYTVQHALLVQQTIGGQPDINNLSILRLDVWALGRALTDNATAMSLRAEQQARLTRGEEEQLASSTDNGMVLLETLRNSLRTIDDLPLQQDFAQLSDLTFKLQLRTRLQLDQLSSPEPFPLAGVDFDKQLADTQAIVLAVFSRTSELINQQTQTNQAAYKRTLIRDSLFGIITFLLMAFMLHYLFRKILRPLDHLQRMLDGAGDAMITTDEHGIIKMINQSSERMFDCLPSSLIGQNITAILKIDQESFQAMYTQNYQQQQYFRGEGLRQNQDRFFAGITVSHFQGPHRHMWSLLIIRDEHQRRIAEASLEHNLSLLSAISKLENMLLSRTPREEVFKRLQQTFLEFTRAEQCLLVALQDFPDDQFSINLQAGHWPDDMPSLETVTEEPEPLSWLLKRLSEIPPWITLPVAPENTARAIVFLLKPDLPFMGRGIHPLIGAYANILGFYEEEDRRINTEAQLRAVLVEEEAVYSASPVGLLRLNDHYQITRANHAAETIFHAHAHSLPGMHLMELLASDQGWFDLTSQLKKLQQTPEEKFSCELECLTSDGRPIWVVFEGQMLFADKTEEGMIIACMDITARKQAEFELRMARDQAHAANRAKSAFLATISHEIRTPMNGVLGMLELLSMTKLNLDQQDTVNTIQDSARTLLRLIDDILDFSKIEADKLEIVRTPTLLRPLLDQVYNLYRDNAVRNGLAFQLIVDPAVTPAVLVDPLRLRQILQNFISNALKFTPQGQVTLRVQVLETEFGTQTLRFEVIDTGIGISTENLNKLFEPFTQADSDTTRRFGGTGLGLTICRKLAGLMGGHVELDSVEGEGTHASLLLVVEEVDPATIEISAPLLRPNDTLPLNLLSASRHSQVAPILLAEDNPTNRKLTLKQLEKLNYAAECAEDGDEAFQKWKQGHYSLLLTDCHMPNIDGYELARLIRAYETEHPERGRIPIIACTANAAKEELDKTQAAGMDDFMTKPLSLLTISAMLEKWLGTAGDTTAEQPFSDNDSQPAPSPAALCPIDRSALEIYSNGDISIELEILRDFQSSNREDADVLFDAVTQADTERISWSSHRIKGASRMVGAMALGDIAEQMEKAGKAGDAVLARQLYPPFAEQLALFENWLTRQDTTPV